MGKAAAKRKMTTTPARDEVDLYLAGVNAKQQFIGSAVSMGWQLALMVIVPVIIGVQLDDHFHASPSYTLAALVLAAMGCIKVVSNTIKQVKKEQTSSDKQEKKIT